jgi:hypothetical protein
MKHQNLALTFKRAFGNRISINTFNMVAEFNKPAPSLIFHSGRPDGMNRSGVKRVERI